MCLLTGTRSIFRVTKYRKVLLYLTGEAPTVRERLLGALKISPDLMHQFVILIQIWFAIKDLCSTKSVSIKFFLYHLHIHPSYTTITTVIQCWQDHGMMNIFNKEELTSHYTPLKHLMTFRIFLHFLTIYLNWIVCLKWLYQSVEYNLWQARSPHYHLLHSAKLIPFAWNHNSTVCTTVLQLEKELIL